VYIPAKIITWRKNLNQTTLTIDLNNPIGRISPRLYGQFAEHLGRCCYDGLWLEMGNRDIPNQDGLRLDVLQALQKMPVTMLRWPGGCYADHYHWRDGIGPVEQRPRRLGMSCGLQVEDDNSFGTHEFLRLCELLGAEPYLAGNVGTGTPQELSDWMEYCNSSLDTTLTRERAANGAKQPFNVRLWGVGNENWGCGGNFDSATYAREYRRYATMLRHVDSSAELVICGFDDQWNVEILQTIRKHHNLIDHLSIHRYWINGGPELDFTEDDYYRLLAEADDTEAFVIRTTEILASETDGSHPIGIALDEWGVWHPEARPWGPGDMPRRPLQSNYEQAGTVRDAIAAAIALEGFHRQCNVLSMANLAQIVNVLHAPVMTHGAQMWLTPTYFLFELHQPHIGAEALPVQVDQGWTLNNGSSAVSATASRQDGGLAVTVTNRHYDQPGEVILEVGDGYQARDGRILAGDSPRAMNTGDQPDQVKLGMITVHADSPGRWRLELPPHSVATVRFTA
jgi:alpha-N-arabinofuranosidase